MHQGEIMANKRKGRRNEHGHLVAKIHELSRGDQQIPMLRLTGKWLAEAGFDLGQPIEIEVKTGELAIRAV